MKREEGEEQISFRHGTCRGWGTKYPILDVIACGKQGIDARQETPTPCFKLWFSSAYIFSFIDYIIIINILLLLLLLILLLFRLINCHMLKIKAKESFSIRDAELFCFSVLCRSEKFALPLFSFSCNRPSFRPLLPEGVFWLCALALMLLISERWHLLIAFRGRWIKVANIHEERTSSEIMYGSSIVS